MNLAQNRRFVAIGVLDLGKCTFDNSTRTGGSGEVSHLLTKLCRVRRGLSQSSGTPSRKVRSTGTLHTPVSRTPVARTVCLISDI